MLKRLGAEFIGTFWLVLGGCGSAVLAAKFGGDGNPLGIGLLGVALAIIFCIFYRGGAINQTAGTRALFLWAAPDGCGKLGDFYVGCIIHAAAHARLRTLDSRPNNGGSADVVCSLF